MTWKWTTMWPQQVGCLLFWDAFMEILSKIPNVQETKIIDLNDFMKSPEPPRKKEKEPISPKNEKEEVPTPKVV